MIKNYNIFEYSYLRKIESLFVIIYSNKLYVG